MRRLSIALFVLVLATLACSLEPTANLSAGIPSTEPEVIPSPTPITPTGTASPETCTVTASEALNLRDAPGVDAVVVAWLAHGDQLTILTHPPAVGAWVKVTTAENLSGWINSNFTDCEVHNERLTQ